MKKIYLYTIILSTAIILYACASKSTDENDYIATESTLTAKSEAKEPSLVLEEPNNKLTAEQKEAFQQRAIQKFKDFTDYTKIISDPNVDVDLKEHSFQLALELFVNDSTFLTDSIIAKSTNNILLKDFLTKIKSRKKSLFINLRTIQFSDPIELDSLNVYKGIIETSFTLKKKPITKKVEVYIITIEKEFGDKKQLVNEVRLGNIY